MTRAEYGGTDQDYVLKAGTGLPDKNRPVQIAYTAGGAVADTTQASGAAWASGPTSDADGLLHYLGPDGYTGRLYVRAGTGPWAGMDPNPSGTYASQAKSSLNLLDMVTPSGSDDTAAVNAALATFAAAGGGTLRIPRANWKFTGSTGVALTGVGTSIHIEADAGTVWDMTGSTATNGVTLGGSVTATAAALGADVAKGAQTITCALTPVAGDILRIQSTVAFNVVLNQPKGELVEVLSVTGGVITLKSGLWDSYTAATTTVTLMQMPEVSVSGLTILRNSNHAGLVVQNARNLSLVGLHLEGARQSLISVINIMGGVVDNCSGVDFWYTGSGNSYGLSVQSCQDLTEIGNRFKGGRHAVSHGGTFPCRNIQVIGGTFDNHHSAGVQSFDFHANCENVRMVGATVLNGITSEASNFDGVDLTVRTVSQHGVSFGVDRDSDYVRLRGCDIQPQGTSVDGVTWTPRGGANAYRTGLFEVDGYVRGGTSGAAVRLTPPTSGDTGSTITKVVTRGTFRGGLAGIVVAKNGGVAAVQIDEFHQFADVTADTNDTMNCTGYATGKLFMHPGSVLRVTQTGRSAFTGATGFPDVYMDGTRLVATNTGDRNYFPTSGGILQMKDCTVEGFGAAGGISAASVGEALITNLTSVSNVGTLSLPSRVYHTRTVSGTVVGMGTAAPAAGTWAVGDEIRHKAPAVGSPKSWLCTVAGTPGTWVSTGNL